MTLQHIDIVFQLIAFLFAISVHESAHAWMANLCGDPTARMLGRITLNPIKHIDPVGTILLPAVALISHVPVIGWAKPTPVDPENFAIPCATTFSPRWSDRSATCSSRLGALLGLGVSNFRASVGAGDRLVARRSATR